jgi:hypothetical protein
MTLSSRELYRGCMYTWSPVMHRVLFPEPWSRELPCRVCVSGSVPDKSWTHVRASMQGMCSGSVPDKPWTCLRTGSMSPAQYIHPKSKYECELTCRQYSFGPMAFCHGDPGWDSTSLPASENCMSCASQDHGQGDLVGIHDAVARGIFLPRTR